MAEPAPKAITPSEEGERQASDLNHQPEERGSSSEVFNPNALLSASVQYWSERSEDDRRKFLLQIDQIVVAILDEIFEEGNLCVRNVKGSFAAHRRWRIGLISATGGLAIVNLVAAYFSPKSGGQSSDYVIVVLLPLIAAIYAAGLAIVTNLESFYNYAAKGQAYRESRDFFLDTYREFEMLWHVGVRSFGDRAEACVNASEVYRLLVERDRKLRGRLRELTAAKKPPSAAKPSND